MTPINLIRKILNNSRHMNIEGTHRFCRNNRQSISESKKCGCFYCLAIYPAYEIKEFMPGENTALCPKCGIDSVICDKDLSFNKQFLTKMNKYWF